jgi:hypothetical protein
VLPTLVNGSLPAVLFSRLLARGRTAAQWSGAAAALV